MLVHDSNPRTSVKEEGRLIEVHGLTGLISEFLPSQSYIRPCFKKIKGKRDCLVDGMPGRSEFIFPRSYKNAM